MKRLLSVVKDDNPASHLEFWKENLQSDYPVLEIRTSNLVNGGLGVFVTDNCFFLPKRLMILPNCNTDPQEHPADKETLMYMYQFAVYHRNRVVYIFPTLEPDSSLPCAQFINTPLRRTQGVYTTNIVPHCRQAMHIGNVKLLGKLPGGFITHRIIYPGFEILGPYNSSYRLPSVPDYWEKHEEYEKIWCKETQDAISNEQTWVNEIKTKHSAKFEIWKKAAFDIDAAIPATEITTIVGFDDNVNEDGHYDDFTNHF